jgi:hypothetical protein
MFVFNIGTSIVFGREIIRFLPPLYVPVVDKEDANSSNSGCSAAKDAGEDLCLKNEDFRL